MDTSFILSVCIMCVRVCAFNQFFDNNFNDDRRCASAHALTSTFRPHSTSLFNTILIVQQLFWVKSLMMITVYTYLYVFKQKKNKQIQHLTFWLVLLGLFSFISYFLILFSTFKLNIKMWRMYGIRQVKKISKLIIIALFVHDCSLFIVNILLVEYVVHCLYLVQKIVIKS